MKPLGRRQRGVIDSMRSNGGYWTQGCGWEWDGVTRDICETLLERGLVIKSRFRASLIRYDYRYDLSPAGLEIDTQTWKERMAAREPPIHRKFGYEIMTEKAAIRDRLLAEGKDAGYMAVEHAWMASREPTVFPIHPQIKTTVRPSLEPFTADELRHLIEHFDGTNDPVSAAIREKAQQMIQQEQEK
jgi:hypothetical protein